LVQNGIPFMMILLNLKQTKGIQARTKNYLKDKFNPGLKQLIQDIEKDTNIFMSYFGESVKIKLEFTEVTHHGRRMLSGNRLI
jgi:hypothetical protein